MKFGLETRQWVALGVIAAGLAIAAATPFMISDTDSRRPIIRDEQIGWDWRPRSSEPSPGMLPTSIEQLARTDDDLWLRDFDGELTRVGLEDGKAEQVYPHGVLQILAVGSNLWALRLTEPPPRMEQERGWTSTVALLNLGKGPVRQVRAFEVSDSGPPILAASRDQVVVIMPGTLEVMSADGSWSSRSLQGRLRPLRGTVTTAITKDGRQVFAGFDAGEFGGGLQRIDLRTAKVHTLGGGRPCNSLLHRDCDAVTSISPDERPGCVMVAIGTAHLSGHGRIVRVCEDKVELMLSRGHRSSNGYVGTEPFYGVSADASGYWVLGSSGLDRIERRTSYRIELPPPRQVHEGVAIQEVGGLTIVPSGFGHVPMLISEGN